MTKHNESDTAVELSISDNKGSKKMPEGKQQFGIIVPIEIHREAKRLALDMDCRISEVYSLGVERILADVNPGEEVPQSNQLSKAHQVYVNALLDFLDSDPDESSMSMLKLILGRHLPKEAIDIRSRGKKKHA